MRKRLWVVGCVVGLLLVMVAPVLAAIAWQWEAGDSCDIWDDDSQFECSGSGVTINASDFVFGSFAVSYALGISASDVPVVVASDCLDNSTFSILPLESPCSVTGVEFSDLAESTFCLEPSNWIRLGNYDQGSSCTVTSIVIGEEDAPVAGMLDNFTAAGIFAVASDVFNALWPVIAFVAGVGLGYTVISYISERLRR